MTYKCRPDITGLRSIMVRTCFMKAIFNFCLRWAIRSVGNPLRCTACLMIFNSCNNFCRVSGS